MLKKLFFICLAVVLSATAFATTYEVSNDAELKSALSKVVAGDEIIVDSGATIQHVTGAISSSCYYSGANGTSGAPITLRSASSTNRAHIRGDKVSSRIVLKIEGDHWIIKDLEFSNSQKGVVFDNSNYSKLINCEVHSTGMEAVHVRDGSDHTLIDNCQIHSTGLTKATVGEAIYVGSDKKHHGTYDPHCDYTTIKYCKIGPGVKAEAFDIKEGTQETTIEYNTVDGDGIGDDDPSDTEDSFIDLKGIRAYVRYNTFNQNGETNLEWGVMAVDRGVDLSSYQHVIHDNTFNLDAGSNVRCVQANRGTSEIHAYNITRNPANEERTYSPDVVQTCPTWYTLCGGKVGVTGVTVEPGALDLKVGESATLNEKVSPDNATNKSVKWSSDDDIIAEVDDNGKVTAKKAGSTKIWVTTNDGSKKASCSVTVKEDNPGGSITIADFSDAQSPNLPENLLDGNTTDDSRWSAYGYPQWVIIDLGESKSIKGIKIWTYDGRAYKYKVEASTSQSSGYTTIVDRTQNTSTTQPISDEFTSLTAKYVKLTVTGAHNYANNWVSLNEIEVVEGTNNGNIGPEGFTYSCDEGQTVNVTGTMDIAYGANGQFNYLRNQTGNVPCNSSTFEDPIPGVAKKCYVKTVNTGGGCDFDLPLTTALPSIDDRYSNVYVDGNAPDLSNIKRFNINWDQDNNGLYTFAVNTWSGSPDWYVNLKSKQSNTFNSVNPSVTISGSGVNLDGDYYVMHDADNFIFAEKAGIYTIIFSKLSATPCESAVPAFKGTSSINLQERGEFTLYPNPANNVLYINRAAEGIATMQILSLDGKLIDNMAIQGRRVGLQVSDYQPGMYIIRINTSDNAVTHKFIVE